MTSHEPIAFQDYEKDTRELAENAAAIISELKRALTEREVLMWAMVRASGGTLLVRHRDLTAGYPAAWTIDEDVAEDGRRFTITKA